MRASLIRRRLLWSACIAIMVWLVAPLAIVFPLSFTDQQSFRFPPTGWSLRWYEEFFTNPAWSSAFRTSILLAVVVTVLATLAGGAIAYAITRSPRVLARGLNAAAMLPIMLPQIVTALAVYMMFLQWRLVGTPIGFVIAHTCLAIPFVVIPMLASLSNISPELERAAISLGATRSATFRTVTLPLAMPGALAGAVLAFATSFDETVISLYLQSPMLRTLPVQMYTSVTSETDPTVAASSVVIIVITTAILLLPFIGQGVRKGRNGREAGVLDGLVGGMK